MDEKQVEAWSRALASRWRGNDESWQLFEPYVRDVLAIIDAPGMLAQTRRDAITAAADAAARHLHANARSSPTGLRAAVLDLIRRDGPAPQRLAAAAE